MIKNLIIIVLVVGVGAFVIRNIYFSGIKSIPQIEHTSTQPIVSAEVHRGTFVGVDITHRVSGAAVVVSTPHGPELRLEQFSSTPAPDLVVYLSKNEDITTSKDLAEHVSLGSLKKLSGEQSYTLPDDYSDYKSVVIWCRAFNILFGAAPLK